MYLDLFQARVGSTGCVGTTGPTLPADAVGPTGAIRPMGPTGPQEPLGSLILLACLANQVYSHITKSSSVFVINLISLYRIEN